MDQQRQQAFQKLRSVCVELSSVALRFKGNQAAAKDVLRALEQQHQTLHILGSQNQLDEKLAEYAFFPLTHVFNESQRLSSRCMEVAVQSLTILVSQGWRQKLAPAMGQQLLILMSLLAGGGPGKKESLATDELKYAAFVCIANLVQALACSPTGKSILQDPKTQNVVDQLAYLLVENLTEAASDNVQIAAATALLQLNTDITSRVFLASLLPRTVSSLTKSLRSSTQARRTRNVLVANLKLLERVLKRVLADNIVFDDDKDEVESEALNDSWLKATVAQIRNALAHVCKLRAHEHGDVRNALFNMCISLIEECSRSLKESIPTLMETAIVLTGSTDDEKAKSRLQDMVLVHPQLAEILQSKFYDWSQSLPRVMLGNDDKPKELVLSRIINAYDVLSGAGSNIENLTDLLGITILQSVVNTLEIKNENTIQTYTKEPNQYLSLLRNEMQRDTRFELILFNHQSQKDSAQCLLKLIQELKQHSSAGKIIQQIIESIPDFDPSRKAAPFWLAIQFLQQEQDTALVIDDFLDLTDVSDSRSNSRSRHVQDLYNEAKDFLLNSSPYNPSERSDSRLVALALEATALQAQQLGYTYRTELYETLYPTLALLSSQDSLIKDHAITTLNILASACQYSSISALLIENVDYLVNSIAWKLNTFNLSPEAPAVLNMVIRLVGAKVVPYLDDLISSIFAALDNFHGYPQWVEMLFEVLRAMVDESVRNPSFAISNAQEKSSHTKPQQCTSTINDILSDLQARKRRKITSNPQASHSDREIAPKRPWTKPQDDPNYKPDPTESKDLETLLREAETADDENDLPAPKEPEDEDNTKPQTKSHELLLKIAQSTVPHLSSPSPRVRHILLQLLNQISPLLAAHENTFLPLVNAIWPGIVPRLFAEPTTSSLDPNDEAAEAEIPYNISAAADVVANLCEHAGDFMSTRIEAIFAQLTTLYMSILKDVEAQIARNTSKQRWTTPNQTLIEDTRGQDITGIVDLQVIKANTDSTRASTSTGTNALATASRTSRGQIFTSLVNLLVSVLDHVRLSEDHADEVFDMLAPLIDHPGDAGEKVNVALERYNPDAVWVLRLRKKVEGEIAVGTRRVDDRVWKDLEMPELNPELAAQGVRLKSIVF